MGSRDLTLTIERSLPNERLDSYLRAQFPAISRGTFQRLITEGHVLVNGHKVKPTHAPVAQEIISIHFPEAKAAVAQPQDIPLNVLFEDDELIVINKPPGLVVHPAAGHDDSTLVNALLHHCEGGLSGIGGVARPGIVHRLDKDTSGCLVAAKNDHAHMSLANQFQSREVSKTYRAILCGAPPKAIGEIRASIARHPSHRKRMAVTEGEGRDAWTSFKVIEYLESASQVEAILHTGRTHQIRVHFQSIGCPLVGDDTYGARKNHTLTVQTGYKAPRQMLHAFRLAFQHPTSKQLVSVEAPLPEDFLDALLHLQEG
jgi:23S rRNA pseudouridine1911/1915/1917 synthase